MLLVLPVQVMAADVSGFTAVTPQFTVTNNDTGEKWEINPSKAEAPSPLILTKESGEGATMTLQVPQGYAYNLSNKENTFPEALTVTTPQGSDRISANPLSSIDFNTQTGQVAVSGQEPINEVYTPASGLDGGLFTAYSITAPSTASPILLTPKAGGITVEGADLTGVTVDGVDASGQVVTTFPVAGGTSVSLKADVNAPSLTQVDEAMLEAVDSAEPVEDPYEYDTGEAPTSEEEDTKEDVEDETVEEEEVTATDTTPAVSNLISAMMLPAAIGSVLALVCFILRAIGFFSLAKKAGLKNSWFSFVPFLNQYILGELIGGRVWGMGGAALILLLASFMPQLIFMALILAFPNAGMIIGIAFSVLSLIVAVYRICAYHKLFKRYQPAGGPVLWTILCVFPSVLGEGLGPFLCRGHEPEDKTPETPPTPPSGWPGGSQNPSDVQAQGFNQPDPWAQGQQGYSQPQQTPQPQQNYGEPNSWQNQGQSPQVQPGTPQPEQWQQGNRPPEAAYTPQAPPPDPWSAPQSTPQPQDSWTPPQNEPASDPWAQTAPQSELKDISGGDNNAPLPDGWQPEGVDPARVEPLVKDEPDDGGWQPPAGDDDLWGGLQ